MSKTAPKPEDWWTVADVKDLNKLEIKVKAAKPILMFRRVRLVNPLVLTVFTLLSQRREKGEFAEDPSQRLLLAVSKNETAVRIMVESNDTVIHRVVGRTWAAESAALATALDRQLHGRLLLESISIENSAGIWCPYFYTCPYAEHAIF